MWKKRTEGWVHDDKNIKGFFGEYRWLSNFHECPVMFQGIMYPSSENAYMASKTIDLELRKQFETCSPKEAKALGKQIPLREDFHEIRLHNMYIIVLDKFSRNEDLKQKLLATGDRYLEETNWWNDVYWGVCKGEGYNYLGYILEDVRTEIKKS